MVCIVFPPCRKAWRLEVCADGDFKGRAYATCADASQDELMEDDDPSHDWWISDAQSMNVYTTPGSNAEQYIRVPEVGLLTWKELMARFETFNVTYAHAEGARAPLVIETVVFEYSLLGGYCWLQFPSLWDVLNLKLYPGAAAVCQFSIHSIKALIGNVILLSSISLVTSLAVPNLLWERLCGWGSLALRVYT